MTTYHIKSHTIEEALAAIERLNKRRTGIERFDGGIEYAIKDWNRYIETQRILDARQAMINTLYSSVNIKTIEAFQ